MRNTGRLVLVSPPRLALVYADHEPDEKSLCGQRSALLQRYSLVSEKNDQAARRGDLAYLCKLLVELGV